MMRLALCTGILASALSFGATLNDVVVSGEGDAKIAFRFEGATNGTVDGVNGDEVRLSFRGANLAGKHGKALRLQSPHLLLGAVNVEADAATPDVLRATLTVNGATEGLAKRTKLQKTADGSWNVELGLPAGLSNSALELLKEEQTPVLSEKPKKTAGSGAGGWTTTLVGVLLVAVAIGGTGFAWRVLRAKSVRSGSRRYLIENLAQMPVGGQGKASVCLLRVGSEFVLVGVSGQNVSFLSNLPKLAEQYEQESELERGSFREAVAEESRRVVPTPAGRVGISV